MKLCNIISTTIGLLLLSNHVHAFITSAAVRASDASSLFLSLPGHASNLHLHDRAQRSSQDGMIRMAKPLRRLPTNAPSLKSTLLRVSVSMSKCLDRALLACSPEFFSSGNVDSYSLTVCNGDETVAPTPSEDGTIMPHPTTSQTTARYGHC